MLAVLANKKLELYRLFLINFYFAIIPSCFPISESTLPEDIRLIDQDGDGFSSEDSDGNILDCNDSDKSVYNQAEERCDGIDNNCDDEIDETFDNDNDGHVLGADCLESLPMDCNDFDDGVYYGAVELCDDIDNNCDDVLDEDFDEDKDGYTICSKYSKDCDDTNGSIHPNALETCDENHIDENCVDGANDEVYDKDDDSYSPCSGDCNDSNSNISPQKLEVCDGKGIDENCNGIADGKYDNDDDKYTTCEGIGGSDCDDSNPSIHPNQNERCDADNYNVDNDCSGGNGDFSVGVSTLGFDTEFATIQEAVDKITSLDETNCTIAVRSGTYTENISWENRVIHLIWEKEEENSLKPLIINDILSQQTTSSPSISVIKMSNAGNSSIKNFKLSNNLATVPISEYSELGNGGAISISGNSYPTITGNHFTQSAATIGGAIYISQEGFTDENNNKTIIKDNSFELCNSYSFGTAIFIEESNNIQIDDNIFEGNANFEASNLEDSIGTLYVSNSSKIEITNNIFRENSVKVSGASIAFHGGINIINIDSNVFEDNVSNDTGGAISFYDTYIDGNVNILLNEFYSNSAVNSGGAISISGVTIANSSINISQNEIVSNFLAPKTILSDNPIRGGGGAITIFNITTDVSSNAITIWDNKFKCNISQRSGGAIYVDETSKATIEANIFQQNSVNAKDVPILESADIVEIQGGALYIRAETSVPILDILNNLFLYNTAYGGNSDNGGSYHGYGNALYISGSSNLIDKYGNITLKSNTFSENNTSTSSELSHETSSVYFELFAPIMSQNIVTFSKNIDTTQAQPYELFVNYGKNDLIKSSSISNIADNVFYRYDYIEYLTNEELISGNILNQDPQYVKAIRSSGSEPYDYTVSNPIIKDAYGAYFVGDVAQIDDIEELTGCE